MELIKDECYWCESPISRPSVNMLWIDDYESADCEFHPYAFDSITLKPTGEHAPHQSIGEVYKIIQDHEVLKKLQRDKTTRLRAVDSNHVITSHNSQRTSNSAAQNILPRTGSIRRLVYDQVKSNNDYGMTDYELEMVLRGKHQTISASRRSLVVDGWIVDSGKTRKNPQGNDCIVWIEKDEFANGMLFA
jgi:hypothetical protein